MDLPALIQQYGYLAVFFGSVLEGETLLVLAGIAAHRGYLSLQWVVAIAAVGAFIGDQTCFLIGRLLGQRVLARWPRLDGSYPDGPGPEVRTQSQLAQLVALGKALLVIPASSRAWQWPDHVAVPVVDAAEVTTVIAWPAGSRSPAIASLVRSAAGLRAAATAG